MLELARNEARHRIAGSITLSVLLAGLAAIALWVYPSFTSALDVDQITELYPEPLLEMFGVRALGTVGGFLATEVYSFGWVILLGMYLAYLGGALVADDVERERMDILLSLPVSRSRLVVEKYLSLLVPIVVVNVVTPIAVYGGVRLIDQSISVADLVAVHALSVPYLLACGAIGLLLSVVFDRTSIAQRGALGVVFGLFLLESLLARTDYEWVGRISPTRYYDPTAVLVDGIYDLAGAAVLSAAAIGLLLVSLGWFRRKDIA